MECLHVHLLQHVMASENTCALQSPEKYYFSKENLTSNVLQT